MMKIQITSSKVKTLIVLVVFLIPFEHRVIQLMQLTVVLNEPIVQRCSNNLYFCQDVSKNAYLLHKWGLHDSKNFGTAS